MNTLEMMPAIGRRVDWQPVPGILVRVEIINVRQVYGRVDLEISPVAGNGRKWVSLDSVRRIDNPGTLDLPPLPDETFYDDPPQTP